jgi:hypothetical protein
MAYTTIDNGESEVLCYLYTGTGNTGANRSLTFNGSVDLEPGQIWMAKRSTTTNYMHNILETEYHGAGYHWLATNSSGLSGPNAGNCDSFDSNGITLDTANQGGYYQNENNIQYVVWAFKATGASNTTNNSGTITSTVRANQDAGMSYVHWAGTGANGTIGHGLTKRPKLIQVFQDTNVNNHTQRPYWWDANSDGYSIRGMLNDAANAEQNTNNGLVTAHRSGEGTSSVFSVLEQNSSFNSVNKSGYSYLAICHHDVQGFKRIGEYNGNSLADDYGPFIYCGFKPALIWIRVMDRTGYTYAYDNARNPDNRNGGEVIGMHGASNTAYSDSNTEIDFLSNGFKIRGTGSGMGQYLNQSGKRYAFFAVAESPFVTSSGVPNTGR